MKMLVAVVTVFVSLLLSGCPGTMQGLRADFESFGEGPLFTSNRQQVVTPEEACEPAYRQRGADSGYRRCLERQIRANLSERDLYTLTHDTSAFQECRGVYRNPRASLWQYRQCQEDAYARKEAQRIETWRNAFARRDGSNARRDWSPQNSSGRRR